MRFTKRAKHESLDTPDNSPCRLEILQSRAFKSPLLKARFCPLIPMLIPVISAWRVSG